MRGSRWQHHQSHCHQRAESLKARHQIDDDEHQKHDVVERATPADGSQKAGVEAFGHQGAIDDGENNQCERGDGADLVERGRIDREDRVAGQKPGSRSRPVSVKRSRMRSWMFSAMGVAS